MELATLCDTKVCTLIFGPDGELESWPKNQSHLKSMIDAFQDCCAKEAVIAEVEKQIDAAETRTEFLKSARPAKEQEVAVFQQEPAQEVMQEPSRFGISSRIPQRQQPRARSHRPIGKNKLDVAHRDMHHEERSRDISCSKNMGFRLNPSMPESVYGHLPVLVDYLRHEVGSSSRTGNGELEKYEPDNSQGRRGNDALDTYPNVFKTIVSYEETHFIRDKKGHSPSVVVEEEVGDTQSELTFSLQQIGTTIPSSTSVLVDASLSEPLGPNKLNITLSLKESQLNSFGMRLRNPIKLLFYVPPDAMLLVFSKLRLDASYKYFVSGCSAVSGNI
ncbi:hypothetical protein RJ639_011141 [Escallonia herrerae]|uniref:MADS-box domain-containing protein n=1 Tax=Escallonia herrerae TaxID=1293975 RepID=A0AA88VNE2_9ASTE|nr:hypothetical protein RJ639_011141 [Escallonia herrerae]